MKSSPARRVRVFNFATYVVTAIATTGLLMLVSPVSSAQTVSIMETFEGAIQNYCRASWSEQGQLDNRLYTACLREQRQALSRIEGVHNLYGRQSFYQFVALPFCRFEQGGSTLNLVQVSFCLENELAGYREVQQLRNRYGAGRVDSEARLALSRSGSWAAAASLIQRETGLKTIRQGGAG